MRIPVAGEAAGRWHAIRRFGEVAVPAGDRFPATEAWVGRGPGRKILAQNHAFGQGLAVADQVIQETAEAHQAGPAAAIGQGRNFLSQTTEPSQNVRIAAQLRGMVQLGVGGVQIAQETIHCRSVIDVCLAAEPRPEFEVTQSKMRSREILCFMTAGEDGGASDFRGRGGTRSRRPVETTGHTAWWCGNPRRAIIAAMESSFNRRSDKLIVAAVMPKRGRCWMRRSKTCPLAGLPDVKMISFWPSPFGTRRSSSLTATVRSK